MSQFIKEIFLPEKINNYYLFSKTIVGIEINKANIIATKTILQGNTRTVELTIEEKITEETSENGVERIAHALTSIFTKIGKYDEIHTALPASLAVFKELKLPFLDYEKINMVIGFEIEPLLPFSLRDAVVDFVITRQIVEEKSSEVLVVAVQKQHIIEHLALFESVGLKPTVITIDMIALYGLYKQIPAYTQLDGGIVLIELNSCVTCITLLVNTQLKMVRTLPKGIISIAKTAAQEVQKTPTEMIDHLLRFGLETTDLAAYTPAIEKAVSEWWDALNFTLTSFSAQLLNRKSFTKVIFFGEGSLVKRLIPFIGQKTGVSSEQLSVESLSENKTFLIKNSNSITPINIISVSTALPLPTTASFNLIKKDFALTNNSLLVKQLILLIVFTIGLFAILITHYTLQTSKLTRELSTSKKEALVAIKETFKDIEEEDLDEAIREAEDELKKQKETWFAFSGPSRASFLQYLLELTSRIDKKSLNFSVDQIAIAEGELTLKAQVRDHDALKILERELGQSPFFSYITPQENPQFTMKIVLATHNGEL